MLFIETRGNDGIKPSEVTFSQAILSPSASYGGLYIPNKLPKIDLEFLEKFKNRDYKELAFNILNPFNIDINEKVIKEALNLYNKFDTPTNPIPIEKVKKNLYVSELYHGPTRAFKDMALQPFGYILSNLAKEKNQNYLILAATSGDTGPAALNTFRNKDNIKVVCLYPKGGTSDVQRLQMVTENAENLKVLGINGNFDDAQNQLKKLLASKTFNEELEKDNIKLSAANSVNFGRIIFQILYHFHSYISLLKNGDIQNGDKIDLVVPSGNFGNALGAYYAKKMGVPIDKIAITSNDNDILTELINNGEYNLNNRELIATKSPAMDILKSSNVERILYDKFGAKRTKELMESLEKDNSYSLTDDELKKLQEDFIAFSSNDDYGKEIIKNYLKDGYLMDPHTATCIKAYENMTLKDENKKIVIYSTAEWTKFSPTVCSALSEKNLEISDLDALEKINKEFNIPITPIISNIFNKEITQKIIIDKEKIEEEVIKFIKN